MIAYYYEGGSVQGDADDPWAIVAEAVEEAADAGRLHAVRVGPMRELAVRELLDAEDIVAMSDDGRLNADALLELVSERCGERVEGGIARMGSPSAAKRSLRKIVQRHMCAEDTAADVIEWADLFFELDPSIYCDGRNPLPIEYVRGEWVYGDPDAEPFEEPLAVIVHVTEPSPETGDVGWCWWVDGRMGCAPTLAAAMARCADEMARKDLHWIGEVEVDDTCSTCGGSGGGDEASTRCHQCGGSGVCPQAADADYDPPDEAYDE